MEGHRAVKYDIYMQDKEAGEIAERLNPAGEGAGYLVEDRFEAENLTLSRLIQPVQQLLQRRTFRSVSDRYATASLPSARSG